MVDVNLLKQIFGDNIIPEEVEEKLKKVADFFKKVQPKEEEEKHKHDCSKCTIPQDLCFAKSEVRDRFKEFAAEKAANSIHRIVGGDPVLASFSMATILKFINPNPEISGLKPTLLEALNAIKEDSDKKAVAEALLDLILLYLWCNNK